MKRIGILSDTHNYLDPKILHYFKDCDEIWHAGDVGSFDVIDQLQALAPLRVVAGNIDGSDMRRMYGEVLRFRCEEIEVLLKHIGGYPGRYDPSIRGSLMANSPQLFVCGHSHILKIKYDKTLGTLCINPGACGYHGWQKERTIVRLTIEGNKFTDCDVITLNNS